MFSRFFIHRPIFASVLSIIITLAGGIAVWVLPIAQYPEITPPTVEVSASYPGADAQVVADTVAAPIEQQVNGVEGMLYMSSQCTNDGNYTLTVTFKLGIDLNMAQVLVQNRVALAQPILPDLVTRKGVMVKKKSPNVLMIVNLFSPNGSRDNLYLSNYATIQLSDELARLPGVGDITYLGQRNYSMRLWLDPEKMASRNLTSSDVVSAIQQQNAQVAAGQIGQPPVPRGQVFQYTMTTLGRLADVDQFSDMTLKTDTDGRIVRMRDVARIELGAQGYDQTCTLDGRPSVALSIYQLPGFNALKTANLVRAKMEELKERFPEGLDYAIVYDTTPFINESIREVFKTLRDAVLLVAFVVLLFLQNWRSADHSPGGRARGHHRHLRGDGRVGLQPEQPHALRPGLGHRHRRRRRHRRGRGGGALYRGGARPAGGHDRGHGASVGAGGCRRAGPQRRVRALRVHPRHHGPVLPPVRLDDRGFHADFGLQFAHPQSGPVGLAAAAERTGRGGRRSVAPPGVPLAGRLAGLRVPGRLASPAARPAAGGVARVLAARRALDHRGSGCAGRLVSRPTAEPRPRLVLPPLQSRIQLLDRSLWPSRGQAAAAERAGVGGLRRPADADLVGVHPRADGLHSRPGQRLPARERATARRRVGRADAAGHAPHRSHRQRHARGQAHRGHRRPIDPAECQCPQFRRHVRDVGRLPSPYRPPTCPVRRWPPGCRPASKRRSRTGWSTSSAPRRSTASARRADSKSSSRTAATAA